METLTIWATSLLGELGDHRVNGRSVTGVERRVEDENAGDDEVGARLSHGGFLQAGSTHRQEAGRLYQSAGDDQWSTSDLVHVDHDKEVTDEADYRANEVEVVGADRVECRDEDGSVRRCETVTRRRRGRSDDRNEQSAAQVAALYQITPPALGAVGLQCELDSGQLLVDGHVRVVDAAPLQHSASLSIAPLHEEVTG
jgi:hypothetical protein